jgi:UDP-glucose 4-epimerase
MENVLVTGGAGFIGSHVVDELVSRGMNVLVVDNESSAANDQYYYNDKATYFKYDITDYNELDRVFHLRLPVGEASLEGIDTVFHLAARSRIPYSIKEPIETCLINYMGTLNVLECARNHGVKRVLYSSTSSAYGLKNKSPQIENMEVDCLNPYSASKVAGENLCKMYHSLYGLETIIFRYFNVYGERHPLKGSYAPVVGIFDRQSNNGEAMTIVGDGLQTRDFTYVKDVVQANILAAESTNENVVGEIFNVGTGKNYSVLDIADMIGGEYTFTEPRKGEARETLADINKIKKLLNYEPKTDLKDWIEGRGV